MYDVPVRFITWDIGGSLAISWAAHPARVFAALFLAAAIYLVAPTSVFAAASYVFEPTLSLTGNCATSPLDEVPDPGPCPMPPGVPGVDHPTKAFSNPSVTTDSYGDIYSMSVAGTEGRIDVFGPNGTFITELKDTAGPQSIAVDAKGNIYLFERISGGERQVRRFPPTVYEPLKGEIQYTEEPVVLVDESTKPILQLGPETSLDVDRSTGRVYVDNGFSISVFGSAAEENELLEKEAIKGFARTTSISIDSVHEKIYASDEVPSSSIVRVFELESPHKELGKITGSTTPKGQFLSLEGFLSIDVDDPFGHVFVGDFTAEKVYEFEEDGTYMATIEHSFKKVPFAEIAVDDGPSSPHLQKEDWLFVPSVPSPSLGHVYAFEPNEEAPPIIESASVDNITETEATLHATINPESVETTYRLEYVSQQAFEARGFAEATIAGEGTLPKGGEGVAVSAATTKLEPGTKYRFRAFAENTKGETEQERIFETFPAEEVPPGCENEAFRIGLSALLPDCRAYELVTPPNTNSRPPFGGTAGVLFPTLEASPDGNRASFVVMGGMIPGYEGSGAGNGEVYVATRGAGGWTTSIAGPSGEEAPAPLPGSVSPDQTYSLWESEAAVYIRNPDGHSALVGRGSLGEDPKVEVGQVTEGAGHIIFGTKASSAIKLEPDAAPEGTATVYDRSAEGPTHVVSLLPGNEPQESGENADYLGTSEDGEGIAFEIGKTIYLRLHNAETLEVAGPAATFAGVANEGKRVFYLEGGNLFAFDAEEGKAIPFSSSGDITLVNVAAGGTRAYLVSPSVLTGEPNPNGEEPEAGAQNLYLSHEGDLSFVAKVTERDVEGKPSTIGQIDGLGLWLDALEVDAPAKDPSRTTPAGTTFLFESRADLTDFESGGFAEVYRYDADENRLDCLSCSPTGTPPSTDASLQSPGEIGGSHMKIANQSPDGKRAFFQTAERLAMRDTDGLLDVYEWEEKGVGSCLKPGGCVRLISGGHSASPDYLYAMSQSGNDVFFRTSDILLPRDAESTLSLYDARVGGGFAEPEPDIPCQEAEECRPNLTPPPALATPGKAGPGEHNVRPRCPKGQRKTRRHGRTVCVKNHRHKKHHHRSGQRKGGRR